MFVYYLNTARSEGRGSEEKMYIAVGEFIVMTTTSILAIARDGVHWKYINCSRLIGCGAVLVTLPFGYYDHVTR